MNIATMPGFTAEASLRHGKPRSGARLPAAGRKSRSESQRNAVVPQRGGEGFEGLVNCLSDCREENPGWTAAQCKKACRPADGPPPPNIDPTNRDLSIGGCWAWWLGCKVNPFTFGCDWARDRCLADVRR
jgi:hypothetical protein